MTITNEARRFTTFEVAKICGVFHTTVINWVNKGKLKAHATPGGHRRIAHADLIEFMERFDMPVPRDIADRARRILVVEDDPSVQRMLVRALQPLPGVELQACAGGLEALISIGKEAPDLLVLDVRIPQVNGLEVCRVLRSNEQTRPIKIVAVSGEILAPADEALLRANVDHYFRKPVPTAELKAMVRDLLELEEGEPAAACARPS